MSEAESRSVVAYYAEDEFHAQSVMSLLEGSGIRAAIDMKWSTPYDGIMTVAKGYYARILVLEEDAERAKELIDGFLARGAMKRGLMELLGEGKVVLCDGAMGSMLIAAGLKAGEPGELMSLEKPEVVRQIHREYKEAGAEILLTNTFGGTRYGLGRYGKEGMVGEVNRAAAKLALEVAAGDCLVLGDVGPTGHLLEPLGDGTVEDFKRAFSEQVEALAAAGVDGIIVETMEAAEELKAAVEAAKETAPELAVVASMRFKEDASGEDYHTMMGVGIPEAVKAMTEAGADVIGSNCGNGPKEMLGVIERMAEITELPILAEPNAGMPKLKEGVEVYELSPEEMAGYVEPLVRAGASVIGGCCGTTPEHISLMKRELERMKKGGRGR